MKDVIHNTSTTHFGIIDRLKILIGGKAVTKLEVTTSNEVFVIGTTVDTHVRYPDWIHRIVRKRETRGGLVLTQDQKIFKP